ncbi:hypothetical protein KQ929_08225 [Leclercia pneumoniae]|uniref:Secreted protein n=1 Tax=Leclercia pneumoniae TaxID=2815358 RepID=A0ABX8JZT6_9ENTR|nr:hypothetical protein JZ655_12280 [Leclercia pneumoniae]QWW81185.1 hypothetical protein KQ929_08225 [Leclercia pneumoniae]
MIQNNLRWRMLLLHFFVTPALPSFPHYLGCIPVHALPYHIASISSVLLQLLDQVISVNHLPVTYKLNDSCTNGAADHACTLFVHHN